jgi:hypothetical protein
MRNVRLQAEVGGKNVSVALADTDLDMAAAAVIAGGGRPADGALSHGTPGLRFFYTRIKASAVRFAW